MSTVDSLFCPNCKTATTLETRAEKPFHAGGPVKYQIGECNNCAQHFLVMRLTANNAIARTYPKMLPGQAPEALPESIKKDFQEALVNQSVSSIRSAVVMARRSLQGICLDQGAPKTKTIKSKGQEKEVKADLSFQIDWLLSQQIITKPLHAMAHEVRSVGNAGAHPEDAMDDTKLTREDASEILALLDAFSQTLYVGPGILGKRTEERQKKLEESEPEEASA